MKHIQKHLKKISKDSIKKVITTLVLLFFAMVMIFQKDAPVATEMNFVRNTEEVFVHNAPDQQREYLFQNESGQQIYQGQIGTGAGIGATETIDNLINADEIAQVLENTQTGAAYT